MSDAQSLYVALLGRPADPNGLVYFNELTKNGTDYSNANVLLSAPEYTDQFAGFDDAGDYVSFYFQRLFNRDADQGAQDYFQAYAAKLGAGKLPALGIAIMEAAQDGDRATLDAKISTADRFTARLDTATWEAAYAGDVEPDRARDYLAKVDATHIPTDQQLGMQMILMVSSGADMHTVGSAGIADLVL